MKFSQKTWFCFFILAVLSVFASLVFLRELKGSERMKRQLGPIAVKIKKIVYNEATIHNPDGDLLPDNWDDEIIHTIKSISK